MNNNPEHIGSITFNVTVAAILVLIVAGLTIVNFFLPVGERVHLIFFLTILGGATAVYGAFYAGRSLKQTIRQNQVKRSFDLIDRLSEVDYVGVRRFITEEIQNHKYQGNNKEENKKELQEKINKNNQLHDKVHQLLGFLESMSQQIQLNFVDEAILYEHCHYIGVQYKIVHN